MYEREKERKKDRAREKERERKWEIETEKEEERERDISCRNKNGTFNIDSLLKIDARFSSWCLIFIVFPPENHNHHNDSRCR